MPRFTIYCSNPTSQWTAEKGFPHRISPSLFSISINFWQSRLNICPIYQTRVYTLESQQPTSCSIPRLKSICIFVCVACVWRLGNQFRSATLCGLGSTRDRRDGIVFVLRSGLQDEGLVCESSGIWGSGELMELEFQLLEARIKNRGVNVIRKCDLEVGKGCARETVSHDRPQPQKFEISQNQKVGTTRKVRSWFGLEVCLFPMHLRPSLANPPDSLSSKIT